MDAAGRSGGSASSSSATQDPVVEYLVTCERVKFARRALSTEEFNVVIEDGIVRGFAVYIVEQWCVIVWGSLRVIRSLAHNIFNDFSFVCLAG